MKLKFELACPVAPAGRYSSSTSTICYCFLTKAQVAAANFFQIYAYGLSLRLTLKFKCWLTLALLYFMRYLLNIFINIRINYYIIKLILIH